MNSEFWKSSEFLSNFVNGIFKQINLLSVLFGKQTIFLFQSLFQVMKNGPKSFLPNMIKFSYFLFDLFSAGLASPSGMMGNVFRILTQLVTLGYLSSCQQTSFICKTTYNILLKSYQNMIKSYFTALFNCGQFFTGGPNGFMGYKGITRNCLTVLSIFFTFFDSLQKKVFDMIFIDSNLAPGGGGDGGGGGIKIEKQSAIYKNNSPIKKINKEINAIVNTNTNANIIEKQNVLYQSEISNVQIIKNRNKNVNRSYLTTAGLFAAFFLLSPSSKKIIPGFSEIRERIQVNSVQSSLSKSTEELSRHILKQKSKQNNSFFQNFQKSVFDFTNSVKGIATNNIFYTYILKNKKLNEEIPSGCPLRRMGLF